MSDDIIRGFRGEDKEAEGIIVGIFTRESPPHPESVTPAQYIAHKCGHCGQSRQTLNGAWLRWKREKAGVGLRELSRRCGLSPAYLSDIERCNRHATLRAEAAYLTMLFMQGAA